MDDNQIQINYLELGIDEKFLRKLKSRSMLDAWRTTLVILARFQIAADQAWDGEHLIDAAFETCKSIIASNLHNEIFHNLTT